MPSNRVPKRAAAVPEDLLDPRQRFLDRLITLRRTREAVAVTYRPYPGDTDDILVVENPLWDNLRLIGAHVRRLHHLSPTDLADLGERLGWVALPAPIRGRVLADLQAAVERGQRLRLRIDDSEAELGDLPWEYIALPGLSNANEGLLALHPSCCLVREQPLTPNNRDVGLLRGLAPGEPLRVLLVYADPPIPELARVAARPQLHRIEHLLDRSAWLTETVVLLPTSQAKSASSIASREVVELQLRQQKPHIVFFAAHGCFDTARDEGAVYLEGATPGSWDLVYASDLATLFPPGEWPRVCLFDVCWSGFRGSSGTGRGVAQAVCAPGRVVVGMQFAWPAASSPAFWNTFFSSLLAPSPLDDCVFEAREMVSRTAINTADWGCPSVWRSESVSQTELPRAVRTPVWTNTLTRLRGALPQHERGAIDEVLRRLPDWRTRVDLGPLVQQWDPLYVVMAGGREEAPVITSPIWWTRLLDPPMAIEWTAREPGSWWVTAWPVGRDDLLRVRVETLPTDGSASPGTVRVDLGSHLNGGWPRDTWIRWEVKPVASVGRGSELVRGAFLVLSAEESAECRAEIEQRSRSFAPEAELALIERLRASGLYETLLQRFSAHRSRYEVGPLGFVARRAVAAAFADMQRQLTLLGLGDPEGLWAAALARRHVEGAYRSVAFDEAAIGEHL